MNYQKNKSTIIGFVIIFVIIGLFCYLLWNVSKDPIAEVSLLDSTRAPYNIEPKVSSESEDKSKPALVIKWEIIPADLKYFPEEQKQEGLEKLSLKISGIVNENIDLADMTNCSYNKNDTIILENTPAYMEMSKNKLGGLSCFFAGKGDQFSINQESSTELVIRQITIDEQDDTPANTQVSRIIKRITIPKETIIEVVK